MIVALSLMLVSSLISGIMFFLQILIMDKKGVNMTSPLMDKEADYFLHRVKSIVNKRLIYILTIEILP